MVGITRSKVISMKLAGGSRNRRFSQICLQHMIIFHSKLLNKQRVSKKVVSWGYVMGILMGIWWIYNDIYIYIYKYHYQSWKRWRISRSISGSPKHSSPIHGSPMNRGLSSWDDFPSNVINQVNPLRITPLSCDHHFRQWVSLYIQHPTSPARFHFAAKEACISLFTSINSRHNPEIMRTLQSNYYPTKL